MAQAQSAGWGTQAGGSNERIDVSYEFALCSWARHFNVSEQRVKEAVAAVGDRAESVRAHLGRSATRRPAGTDRPSSH